MHLSPHQKIIESVGAMKNKTPTSVDVIFMEFIEMPKAFFRWIFIMGSHIENNILRNPFFFNSRFVADKANGVIVKSKTNQNLLIKSLKVPGEKDAPFVIKHRGIECDGDIVFAFDEFFGTIHHFFVHQHHVVIWWKFVVATIKLFAEIVRGNDMEFAAWVFRGISSTEGRFPDRGRAANQNDSIHAVILLQWGASNQHFLSFTSLRDISWKNNPFYF